MTVGGASDKMSAFKNAMENKNATRADKFIALNHAHSAVVAKMQSLETDEERKAIEDAFVKEQNRCLRLQRKRCTTNDFEVIRTIGQGAFGVVRVVKHKEDKEIYALKQMAKKSMKKKNQRDRVVAEKCLLSRMEDTWVGTLYQTFQDEDNLYMVMEFLPGGDMIWKARVLGGTVRAGVGSLSCLSPLCYNRTMLAQSSVLVDGCCNQLLVTGP